jgi:hypothetical protein
MRSFRHGLVILTVLALVAAACGDRSDDESGTTAPAEEAQPSEGDFGDLEGVCGPAEGDGGGAPAGDASETQGATEDTIRLGTVSDPGFEGRPGLNIELHDTAEAFRDWCNEAGGINGKQIELTLYDAAINNYEPQLTAACENEFALVGSGAVQDNLWPEVGAACGLIDVAGFSVTPEKAGVSGRDAVAERTIQPVPNPADRQPVAALSLLADEFPDALARGGVVYADLQTLILQRDKEKAAFSQVGVEWVSEAAYNILGEANWAPFAVDIEGDEVSFLRFIGEGENLAQLQQALTESGYTPDVTFQGANFYDEQYLAAAGDTAEGTYVETVFWPFEEAAENPATQQYLDLLEAQGGKVALLGAQSMSGWLLFATAAGDCDREGTLTRSCVLDKTSQVTEWTGGGLHAPTNPAQNEPSSCQILLRVEGGAFVRDAPTDEDFACDDAYVVSI